MAEIEIQLMERTTPWTMVVNEDVVTLSCDVLPDLSQPPEQVAFAAAELPKRLSVTLGPFSANIMKVRGESGTHTFVLEKYAWAKLQPVLSKYPREFAAGQHKERAIIVSSLLLFALGEPILSWSSMLLPTAILLALLWAVAFFMPRASALLTGAVFLGLVFVSDVVALLLIDDTDWSQWIFPLFVLAMAGGNVKSYRWLAQLAPPRAIEVILAVVAGLGLFSGLAAFALLSG